MFLKDFDKRNKKRKYRRQSKLVSQVTSIHMAFDQDFDTFPLLSAFHCTILTNLSEQVLEFFPLSSSSSPHQPWSHRHLHREDATQTLKRTFGSYESL